MQKQKKEEPTLAAAIRSIRKRLGENLAFFGLRLGVSTSNVSRYESGKTTPSGEVLLKLLSLAGQEEENVVRTALYSRMKEGDPVAQAVEDDLAEAITEFIRGGPTLQRTNPRLFQLTELVNDIRRTGDVDKSVLSILRLWLYHHKVGKPVVRLFRVAEEFFAIEHRNGSHGGYT